MEKFLVKSANAETSSPSCASPSPEKPFSSPPPVQHQTPSKPPCSSASSSPQIQTKSHRTTQKSSKALAVSPRALTPSSKASTPSSKASTPKSSTSRGGWTVVLLKMGKKIQMHILCRRSNGRIGPFSSAPAASKRRPMWEPITECDYKVKIENGGFKKTFEFENSDNEKATFRADNMDPLLTSVNPYSQKVASLLVMKPKLLAAYFTLLSCSEHFCYFKPEIHDQNGVMKDGSGIDEDALGRLGGSLSDFEAFTKVAVENVAVIGGRDEPSLKISPASKKRKLTDFFNVTDKKQTKTEKTEQNYQEMVAEEGGLEKSVVSSYVQCLRICLDKLSVSPDLFLPVNPIKVNDIAESMTERLEVSQLVVSVIPADIERFEREGDDEHFWVVHGAHRFEAMKKVDLIHRSKTKAVPGFPEDRSIMCFILKVDAASLTNYLNIKCNDLATEFQSSASNEALFFVYHGLVERTKDNSEALEVVLKIAHSRHLGPNDLTVYRKVTTWPNPVLDKLISVLGGFQTFQTTDAKARGVQKRIRQRQPNIMSTTMFRQLGGCSPQYFLDNHVKVLENIISLKELLEASDKSNRSAKEKQKVVTCADGVFDIASLQTKYPNKFSSEALEQFAGAEPYGRNKNPQGQRLKQYVKCVQIGRTYDDPIQIDKIEHFSDVSSTELENFDVVILNVCKDNVEFVKCCIDSLCCSIKDFYSVFLVLDSQDDLVEVYQWLQTWKEKPEFKIQQLLFRKEKSFPSSENINENATFCILFGKVTVFKDQLFALNDDIRKDLKNLVAKVTPPGGRVAYVSKGDGKVMQVHKENQVVESSDVQYKYFVMASEFAKVQKMFFIAAAPVPNLIEKPSEKEDSESEMVDEEEDGEMETDAENCDYGLFGSGDSDNLMRQSSTSSTKY